MSSIYCIYLHHLVISVQTYTMEFFNSRNTILADAYVRRLFLHLAFHSHAQPIWQLSYLHPPEVQLYSVSLTKNSTSINMSICMFCMLFSEHIVSQAFTLRTLTLRSGTLGCGTDVPICFHHKYFSTQIFKSWGLGPNKPALKDNTYGIFTSRAWLPCKLARIKLSHIENYYIIIIISN